MASRLHKMEKTTRWAANLLPSFMYGRVTSPSRLKYRKMASATRKAANRYFNGNIKFYDGKNGMYDKDNEMVAMLLDDRKQLRKFATLLNQGSINKASRMIYHMDTAIYEEIPNRVYNYVYDRGWSVR